MPNVWPVTLPQFVSVEGFQETPPDLLLRTQMDAGPPKVRRRFTAGVRGFKATVRLTQAQVQVLDAFFVGTLAGGALSFDWTHPRTGVNSSFRMSRPAYSSEGGDSWVAGFELELLP